MTLDLFPHFLAWQEKHGGGETFFLDSFRSPAGRYSYFPLSAPEKTFRASTPKDFHPAWKSLQSEMRSSARATPVKNGPPFTGGAVGMLSYDAGRFFDDGWRTPAPSDPLRFPLLNFGIYNDLVCLDHKSGRLHFFSKNSKRREQLRAKFMSLTPPHSNIKRKAKNSRAGAAEDEANKKWFLKSVQKIKNYIAQGDVYQANLSQRLERNFNGSGLDFFARLREINPSPYSCYFQFQGFEAVSCSPELLIRKRGDLVETRPIAGTRPRGKNRAQDLRLKGELLLSPKEKAEHIMLVDLERNDLGRVCKAGTVRVTERMGIERYSHVMHIVSHVKGNLRKGRKFFDALAAVFPGGTITGCPKVRCMEILDETEPVARGPFYGSAGWIGRGGNAEMNLLIRTAVISKGRVSIQCGSGIVADSDPQKEFEESLHKARALLENLT